MLLTSLFLVAASPLQGAVTMKLLPSGATAKVGYYMPQGAELGGTPTAKAAKGLESPQYGKIKLGSREIAFALAEPAGKEPTIVFDLNGDGDLSNDAPATFKQGDSKEVRFGSIMVPSADGTLVSVNYYTFKPKDAKESEEKPTLYYYADYGYEIGFSLDGKPYTAFIPGDATEQTSIGIDRNGDGKISAFRETARIGKPFNFTGTTYTFGLKEGKLDLATASTPLPMAPLPPDLRVGKTVLPIKKTALDGKPVDLLKDYKGKLVMVDFWATWCGPCIGEIPHMKEAYEKYRGKGFDILGISFDQPEMTEKLQEFLKKEGLPWRQVYEGKGWDTETGRAFDVNSIPFVLLVDGDTGEILATARELRGPGLSEFIGKKLAEKRAKTTNR